MFRLKFPLVKSGLYVLYGPEGIVIKNLIYFVISTLTEHAGTFFLKVIALIIGVLSFERRFSKLFLVNFKFFWQFLLSALPR